MLALPVFVLEMGSHLIPGMHEWVIKTIGLQQSWYWQFALTLLVLTLPGRRFYLKGFPALARLAPDMNSLVAVGTAAAFGYSLVATFTPDLLPEGTVNVYYEAAAVIVALILLGRFLEARAKGGLPKRLNVWWGYRRGSRMCYARAASWISLSTRLCWATVWRFGQRADPG